MTTQNDAQIVFDRAIKQNKPAADAFASAVLHAKAHGIEGVENYKFLFGKLKSHLQANGSEVVLDLSRFNPSSHDRPEAIKTKNDICLNIVAALFYFMRENPYEISKLTINLTTELTTNAANKLSQMLTNFLGDNGDKLPEHLENFTLNLKDGNKQGLTEAAVVSILTAASNSSSSIDINNVPNIKKYLQYYYPKQTQPAASVMQDDCDDPNESDKLMRASSKTVALPNEMPGLTVKYLGKVDSSFKKNMALSISQDPVSKVQRYFGF